MASILSDKHKIYQGKERNEVDLPQAGVKAIEL